jgi:hypothetical protein
MIEMRNGYEDVDGLMVASLAESVPSSGAIAEAADRVLGGEEEAHDGQAN